jgi:hypothetical protein
LIRIAGNQQQFGHPVARIDLQQVGKDTIAQGNRARVVAVQQLQRSGFL